MYLAAKMSVAIALALAALPAGAMTVLGVYNTGLGAGGAALASGTGRTDANYTIIGGTAAEAVIGAAAKTYNEFDWFAPDTAAARAINATGTTGGSSSATTIYRTTFNLTGYNLATVVLRGTAQADDTARVELNGHDLGILADYDAATVFEARATELFNAHSNTLDFIVHNNSGNSALRVAGLEVTGDVRVALVPEPASWVLMAGGFGLVGAVARRRRTGRGADPARRTLAATA